MLLETGLPRKFASRMSFGNQELSIDLYVQLQAYLLDLRIKGFSGECIDTISLIYLSICLNLEKPLLIAQADNYETLKMPVDR